MHLALPSAALLDWQGYRKTWNPALTLVATMLFLYHVYILHTVSSYDPIILQYCVSVLVLQIPFIFPIFYCSRQELTLLFC
jgi:hypothetical protein